MKILVTGATGFVGLPLVKNLANNPNHKILAVGRNIEKYTEFFSEKKKNLIFKFADNWDSIKLFSPDIVIHLASYNTSKDDLESITKLVDSNILYGVKLLNLLKNCKNLQLFIYPGSFSEYDDKNNERRNAYLYSASKEAFLPFVEYYSNKYNFKYINPVFYTVYGNKPSIKRIIDYVFEALGSEIPVKMTEGEQQLDFIHIDDVIKFIINVIENKGTIINGETFFIGTGKTHSIKELAKLVEDVTNKKCNIEWGALPYRDNDIMYASAPLHKNNPLIKWVPSISLQDGIGQYIKENNP